MALRIGQSCAVEVGGDLLELTYNPIDLGSQALAGDSTLTQFVGEDRIALAADVLETAKTHGKAWDLRTTRRAGKTSLVNRMLELARRDGSVVAAVLNGNRFAGASSPAEMYHSIVSLLQQGARDRTDPLVANAHLLPGIEFPGDADPTMAFWKWLEICSRTVPILFLMDEISPVYRIDPRFFRGWRAQCSDVGASVAFAYGCGCPSTSMGNGPECREILDSQTDIT